ncbi:metalloregulator ArsR/SmtB family transcription factor [Flavobacterium agricola]|uniref:Metalloregulator ArsR/SmtB family transcription factor n=1 Tax=Flavobacterium agricola TaxID=2870839 RepID=A0ABY6LXA8_9FLAO|nr:metalloregulator ArsR/SmtB family transcription factor [Flavobacterium agricola]UYW00967.1 metalloregulator ArsR/SmtB family transcription factor [Flavobacterium agricola]
MGITKSEIFTEQQNQLANLFKVLGHPARLAILQHIINQKACICTDLVQELGLAQATISQHLKVLKDAEIIKGEIEGKSVCYCINQSVWEQMQAQFTQFFIQFEPINTCC